SGTSSGGPTSRASSGSCVSRWCSTDATSGIPTSSASSASPTTASAGGDARQRGEDRAPRRAPVDEGLARGTAAEDPHRRGVTAAQVVGHRRRAPGAQREAARAQDGDELEERDAYQPGGDAMIDDEAHAEELLAQRQAKHLVDLGILDGDRGLGRRLDGAGDRERGLAGELEELEAAAL